MLLPRYKSVVCFADRTDWLAISLIAVLALVPRVCLLVLLPPILHLDSDSYFEIAQRLWNQGTLGDLSRRAPLYPLLLSAAGHPRQAGLFPVVLLQHLFGVASAVLYYLIARRLFSPRNRLIAIASGLLAGLVIYPVLIEHSILSETLYSFLLLAASYLLLAWFQENRTWMAIGCGALLALAAVTRPVAAGVFLVWAALLFPLRGRKRATRFLFAAGSAFALLLVPLLVRNYRVVGAFGLTQSLGRNLISVADQFVDYDRGAQLPVKSVYREFLKEKRGPDAVVVYSAMPKLRSATQWNDVQIDRALAQIAWEGIRAHPFEYIASRMRRLPLLFRDPAASQWYALHPETYLPVLEFIARLNPELVRRSIELPALRHTRFNLTAFIYRVFAIDVTAAWLMLFPLAGIVFAIWRERQRAAWLFVALLVYSSLGTILVQPPNVRYRMPALPLELLFAAAGYYFAAEFLAGLVKRYWRLRRTEASASDSERVLVSSSQTLVVGAVVAVLTIVAVRANVAVPKPVFSVADFRKGQADHASGDQRLAIRELVMAGRKMPVLYWNGEAGGGSQSISADVPMRGGRRYHLQVAYSCESRECARAALRISSLDAAGATVGPSVPISFPLAQERVDNDLFWDQIERQFELQPGTRRMRIELAVGGGTGSLVIPYLSIER